MKSKKIITGILWVGLIVLSARTGLTQSPLQEMPNILWITSEDNSPFYLGCYGSDLGTTPNLDKLAEQGFRYTHAYADAPICAPSRNTIITGVYASSGGNQHMRSNYSKSKVLQLLPEYFRKLGYYCTNNFKEDYNIEGSKIEEGAPGVIWDESSTKAHYKNRKPGQPFFAVFNTMISHESSIHPSDSGRAPRHDPAKVKLPPYHPDTKEMRHDWARYYDVIEKMDAWVGEKLKELDNAGLADNTIVIYYGDHGGILARSKRYLYETGTHIPFIIRIPEKYKYLYPAANPGSAVDRTISLIDLYPTMLSMVGIRELPKHLQGRAFLGPLEGEEPSYVYGLRGRMDERVDMMRSVRDKRFRYIRNYYPYRSNGIYNRYMWRAASTRSWHQAYLDGRCNAAQSAYFQIKPVEELYDTKNDYWEVNNLANDPRYREVLLRMRAENNRWMERTFDTGFFPEAELKRISQTQPMYDYMRSGREDIKQHIAVADLADFATVKDLDQLSKNLSDKSVVVRYWAALGLRKLGEQAKPAIPGLTKALNDPAPDVAMAASEALYFAGLKEPAVKTLISFLQSPDMIVRLNALNVIDVTCKYDKSVLKAIEKMLTRPDMSENQFDTFLGKWMLESGKKGDVAYTKNSEEQYGWQLGVQAYTFRGFSFSETLKKIDSCGLKYVEAYPRQPIGNGIEGTMDFNMNAATRAKIRDMLAAGGIKLIAYGVVKASGPEEWKKVFEFCKDLGIQTITCEPTINDLAVVSSLCDDYHINAAIHNHPAPTAYWSPDSVLNAIKGKSARLGACADIGHWVRSGLDPVACLKKLKGHIKHFHFKDISQIDNKETSEVIWGRGLCNIPGVMQEMRSQQFKGMISVEYEHNLNNNIEPIMRSADYFRNYLK